MSDCILWTGYVRNGYGMKSYNNKVKYIHRVECEKANGPPPTPHHQAAHKCGVRRCINGEHLYWATRKENMADAVVHGTAARGDRHGMRRLSEIEVRAIRQSNLSSYKLAKTYHVAASTIRSARNGTNWRSVA